MDHTDIVSMIEAGQVEAAKEAIAGREAKGGISGEDGQKLNAMLAGVKPKKVPSTHFSRSERRVETNSETGDLEFAETS